MDLITITIHMQKMVFQTLPRLYLIDPKKPNRRNPSLFGTGTVRYRYHATKSPKVIVKGRAFRLNRLAYQVMNRGPIPKARVPPVLNTDMANPVLFPE